MLRVREDAVTPIEFYSALCDNYDLMTRFEQRLENQRQIIQELVQRYRISSVIDVGCGSGVHAILLAEADVEVVAVDPTPELIEQAQTNAEKAGVQVDWRVASLDNLATTVSGRFDAILCLGNTLSHILTQNELMRSLEGVRGLMTDGAVLLVQLLNYDRVLSKRERVVGIHRAGDHEFVRFYDFADPRLFFNILIIEWQDDKADHRLITTELYPWRSRELSQMLETAGFKDVNLLGDLRGTPFHPDESSNLVIEARR
jgi:ubiquinone/menaquinone biosynthesis C-methylase UbiE